MIKEGIYGMHLTTSLLSRRFYSFIGDANFFFTLILSSILLLAEGRTAYMGSRADAIQYFERYVYVP